MKDYKNGNALAKTKKKKNYIISTDFKENIEAIPERMEIMFGRPTVRKRLGSLMT